MSHVIRLRTWNLQSLLLYILHRWSLYNQIRVMICNLSILFLIKCISIQGPHRAHVIRQRTSTVIGMFLVHSCFEGLTKSLIHWMLWQLPFTIVWRVVIMMQHVNVVVMAVVSRHLIPKLLSFVLLNGLIGINHFYVNITLDEVLVHKRLFLWLDMVWGD